jgi:hypothetical protein
MMRVYLLPPSTAQRIISLLLQVGPEVGHERSQSRKGIAGVVVGREERPSPFPSEGNDSLLSDLSLKQQTLQDLTTPTNT